MDVIFFSTPSLDALSTVYFQDNCVLLCRCNGLGEILKKILALGSDAKKGLLDGGIHEGIR